MTEEDQDSLRPISPYHEKCFPPYCDSAGQVDKQSVSKMNRVDLEDKYIVFADENLNLKKRIRDHERQIQRLQTAMARQDHIDKKGGVKMPPSVQYDNVRLDHLEQQNKNLQAKVKVLKLQLMNHSFIHSKENKIAENKEKQYKNPDHFRDVGQTQSARDSKTHKSPSPSARELKNSSALKERIALLENQLDKQKEKFKARIAQLEKEVAVLNKSGRNLNEELIKVNDNVEIIKLRRESEKLATQINVLSDQNEDLRKELDELKVALSKADTSVAELERILERERDKVKEANTNLSKSISHTETIRVLQEEIRDLKNERKELKEANERLLLLTTSSPKSDRSIGLEPKLKQQISALELKLIDKTKELEDKEEEVARLEALLKDSTDTPLKSVASKSSVAVGKEGLNPNEKLHGKQLSQQMEELSLNKPPFNALNTRIAERINSDTEVKKISLQVNSNDYLNEFDMYMNHDEKLTKISNLDGKAVAVYQRKEDVLNNLLLQEHQPTPPRTPPPLTHAPSEHEVKQVPGETATKPILLIVSKHQFDAILIKKKKYYSQTEMMVPLDGQKFYNCKLEVCIYDLEVDNIMVHYISEIESEPLVFVMWNFLGLEQSTLSMPLTRAHFQTNVVYFGPLSEDMTQHVQETEMPIQLMLIKSSANAVKVGEGKLDLMPAINQPNRGFLRTVNLSTDQGLAKVYCFFKLHECCLQTEQLKPSMVETLEVEIGHLKLNKYDQTSPNANHLYIEYSLLGYCGPELETDSIPKADVMRFNHIKRLRVTESNSIHLEPMLKPHHAKALRFLVLSEPCSLTQGTEIEEIGHADLNLMEEIVRKDQDLISKEIPVFDNENQLMGSLSVTVIGKSTLQNHMKRQRS